LANIRRHSLTLATVEKVLLVITLYIQVGLLYYRKTSNTSRVSNWSRLPPYGTSTISRKYKVQVSVFRSIWSTVTAIVHTTEKVYYPGMASW